MSAAWYEKQGLAGEVLTVGEMQIQPPGPEKFAHASGISGINPGATEQRRDVFGVGMPYPGVIPDSDVAGIVDRVAADFPTSCLVNACGASAHKLSSPMEPLQNFLACLEIKLHR